MDQEKLTNQWLNEFKNSDDLRAEFGGDVDAYVAFKKADADGKVGILGRKTVSADA